MCDGTLDCQSRCRLYSDPGAASIFLVVQALANLARDHLFACGPHSWAYYRPGLAT